MVISHVIGGLGNQMFQYAAARALSLARAAPLYLDVSDFPGYELHQGFELARVFCCPISLAQPAAIRSLLGWQSSRLAQRILGSASLSALRSPRFVVEPHFHYWAGLRKVPLPCYLKGYWQSERYFADAADTIRADFSFREPTNGKNLELEQEISRINAVSLHVRRGDYVSNPKTLAVHGVCSLDYYREAIRYIEERVVAPHFFIFSDDLNWVKKEIPISHPCYHVDHNRGAASYNDMRLMSFCRHHIIANSSFSWWGAWLDPRPDKIVVAPKKWFNNYQADTSDLIPHGWVRL